jgi:hypothetical protein
MKTYEGAEVWLHHSWHRHYLEVGGKIHVSNALPPGKEPRYGLDRRADGPQSRSGCCAEQNNFYPCQESNPSHPTRSPSLYRLSYPGSVFWMYSVQNSVWTQTILTEVVRGFIQPLQATALILPRLGHYRVLPNPFQFIIYRTVGRYAISTLKKQH